VFRTDSVLLHLRDGDQVYAHAGNAGAFSPGVRAQACRALEPPSEAISVVEDPAADPRRAPRASLHLKLHNAFMHSCFWKPVNTRAALHARSAQCSSALLRASFYLALWVLEEYS
jgi:hypothetical protein